MVNGLIIVVKDLTIVAKQYKEATPIRFNPQLTVIQNQLLLETMAKHLRL